MNDDFINSPMAHQVTAFEPEDTVMFPLSIPSDRFVTGLQEAAELPLTGDLLLTTGMNSETKETSHFVITNVKDFNDVFSSLPIFKGETVLIVKGDGKVYSMDIEDPLIVEELGAAVYQETPYPYDTDQILTPQGFMTVV